MHQFRRAPENRHLFFLFYKRHARARRSKH
jgi:hypothetical protein